ncbi:hypothetical protein ACFQ1S_00335 [Kibdelosporangium lantanae]|uniref:Uncharacterized protein n=1 Tax=Kibdelosporangium lantanae TaxID=1497396 RepID=A0ABW3M0U6_9PSEU
MQSTNTEFIKAIAEDWLECECRNHPEACGFALTDRDGRNLDNNPELWIERLYRCNQCGLIVDHSTIDLDAQTVRVVGRVAPPFDD